MHEDEINSRSDDNNGKEVQAAAAPEDISNKTQANALNVTFPHKPNRVSVAPGRTVNSLHHVESAGAKK
jgi:hypothetical protein